MPDFYPEQLRQQYRLLGHKGHYTQVSCVATTTGKQPSRETLNDEEKVIAWAKEWNGKGNCFIGRNPRIANGDLQHCASLSLDIDPIRPKGEVATEGAHQEALRTAKKITAFFHYGVVCGSGNGALVLFPLQKPVTKETAERWGKALEAEARKLCEGTNLNVDHTFDAPRLCKALGTLSTKGDKHLWRHAKFISDPRQPGDIKAFYKWLDTVPEEAPKLTFSAALPKGELDRSKADIALASRLKLQGFSAADTYKSLQAYSTRPERDDDHKRIINKLYYGEGNLASMVSGREERPLELITPQSGLLGYTNRRSTGSPELPTGFAAIDRATFGLVRGTIFTVGARTGCGKTTFAVGAALNLCRAGKRVLYLSTETTYQEVWDRYAAIGTEVSAFSLQHGFKLNGHQQQVDKFMQEFATSHQLTVYDGSRPSVGILRRLIDQASPDVLVLDYFQHTDARDTRGLEEFVLDMHDLLKEKNVAGLVCAQLHTRMNPQTNKPYQVNLQDMKNSKVLNDESRVVVLLDWDNTNAQGDGPQAVKAIMAKNRGPRNDVVLRLDRSIPRFTEGA